MERLKKIIGSIASVILTILALPLIGEKYDIKLKR